MTDNPPVYYTPYGILHNWGVGGKAVSNREKQYAEFIAVDKSKALPSPPYDLHNLVFMGIEIAITIDLTRGGHIEDFSKPNWQDEKFQIINSAKGVTHELSWDKIDDKNHELYAKWICPFETWLDDTIRVQPKDGTIVGDCLVVYVATWYEPNLP